MAPAVPAPPHNGRQCVQRGVTMMSAPADADRLSAVVSPAQPTTTILKTNTGRIFDPTSLPGGEGQRAACCQGGALAASVRAAFCGKLTPAPVPRGGKGGVLRT